MRRNVVRLARVGVNMNNGGALGCVADEAIAFLRGVVLMNGPRDAGYQETDEAQKCQQSHTRSLSAYSTQYLTLYGKKTVTVSTQFNLDDIFRCKQTDKIVISG